MTANPTLKTQKEILTFIKDNNMPVSYSAIAKATGKNTDQVKASVSFFEDLGLLKTIQSLTFTLVLLKEAR